MRLSAVFLISLLLSLAASCQSNLVLVCKGTSSYAYHDHYCDGLNRCRAVVVKVSLSTAKSMRRTPCGYCYGQSSAPGVKKKSGPAATGQCTATTKKGTRCSRSARSARRCWQHGG